MSFSHPRAASAALALVLAMAATACGDDSETGEGGGSATSAASTSDAASTSNTTSSGDATSSGSGSGGDGGTGGGAIGCSPAAPGLDDDTSVDGPFDVGARTVLVDGLTVEVWYPAAGTLEGVAKQYDLRDHLPASEVDKVSDEKTALQTCDCFDQVDIDTDSGPFPVLLFVHGTAGFRTQSLELVTHWASRGFVVIAADHPGLQLRDLLQLACGQGLTPRDLDADIATLHDAIQSPSGDLAFLDGRIDPSQLALAGHSAGGAAIEAKGDIGRVLIPLAAGGVAEGDTLDSTLVMGGIEDQVVPFASQEDGFASSPAPKRLVGLGNAGHLIFSSLCSLRNADGQSIVDLGVEAGVCGVELADGLFDCSDGYIPDETGWTIIRDATSAALEETLLCLPERGAWLADIEGRYPEVAVFDEAL